MNPHIFQIRLTQYVSLQIEQRSSALDSFEEISQLATSKEIVLFLDYDGTLAEIVNDPDKAFLSDEVNGKLYIVYVIIFS